MVGVELRPVRGGALLPPALVVAGLGLLGTATIADRGVGPAAGLLVALSVLAVGYRLILRWDALVAIVMLVVLFIPIKRYGFAVSLPFDLEPYRIAIAAVLAVWLAALLVDPGVRLRGSAVDAPLLLFGLAVTASVALNPDTILHYDVVRSYVGSLKDFAGDFSETARVDVAGNVTKELLFLASFFLTFYFVVSVVRSPASIHLVLKTLVLGGAAVAASAVVERRTGYNVFDHLGWIPLIDFQGGSGGLIRSGRLRVFASAQHPIALAVLFVLILPLSYYLGRQTRNRLWHAPTAVLLLGALATVSRTSITMLAAVIVVFAVLRRNEVKRLWPIVVPLVVVLHLLIPGTIGGLRGAFFPDEGIVADQTAFGGRISSVRLQPQFEAIEEQPAFGQGYGTRITAGENQNARILDNQWLATAVETGLVGVFAWAWLFVRFIRRAGREAKRDESLRGLLLTSIAASVAAFAVAMFTLDSFSFIQSTFIFFVLLALGSCVLAWEGEWPDPEKRNRGPSDGGLPAERLAGPSRKPPQRLLTS